MQKHACGECAKDIIEELPLSELNAQDGKGETALIKAIKTKRKEIAQILIEKGVDVNIQDKKGRTALHWAVDNPLPEVYYDMLIQHDAIRIDITDNDGRTPFEYLLENKMTSYLRSKTVWPRQHDSNGKDKDEFIKLYQNVVKQLFDIIFPQLQRIKHDFDDNENELVGDIISIIETTYPFTKMIQTDETMTKIQQSVQNFFQQLSGKRMEHVEEDVEGYQPPLPPGYTQSSGILPPPEPPGILTSNRRPGPYGSVLTRSPLHVSRLDRPEGGQVG